MLILALTHIQDSELHKSPETLQKDCINMKNHVCIFTQGHTHTHSIWLLAFAKLH